MWIFTVADRVPKEGRSKLQSRSSKKKLTMSDLRVELAERGGEDVVHSSGSVLRMDSKDGQRRDDAAFFIEFNNQPQADWRKLRRQGGRRKEDRLGAQFAVEGGIKVLKLQVERGGPLWMCVEETAKWCGFSPPAGIRLARLARYLGRRRAADSRRQVDLFLPNNGDDQGPR